MDVEQAWKVLRVLTAAYPTYPVGEDTAELYLAVLTDANRRAEDGMAAVRTWVEEQDHFPRVTELLAAVQAAARKRSAANPPPKILDETVEPPCDRPGCPCSLTGAEAVRELRAQLPKLVKRAP